MKLKGILFDFNGTLFFDSDFHMEAFRRVYKDYGMLPPAEETMIERFFGRTNRTIYTENFNPNASSEEIAEFTRRKESAYIDICRGLGNKLSLAKGAVEMLDAIKEQNIPYCLATGSERGNIEFYMEALDLWRWFDWEHIVYEDGSFPGKPAPDIYNIAAARIGLKTSECLVFEDGTSGIRAANAANAGAVIVVYDKKYPSPVTHETKVNNIFHDHTNWKNTLIKYRILE